MEAEDILRIHKLIWKETPPDSIEYNGDTINVVVLNTNSRHFRSVAVQDLLIVTQNLAKPTVNTEWVKAAKGRKLTWIFKNNSYYGKVTSEVRYVHDEGCNVWSHYVYKLNPDRIVYQTEEKEKVNGGSKD